MNKSTTLASSRITSADDIITVTYVEPLDAPAAVFLRWPYQPSVTTPDRLPAVANAVMAVLAEAIANWRNFGPANGSSQLRVVARLACRPVPVRAILGRQGPGIAHRSALL